MHTFGRRPDTLVAKNCLIPVNIGQIEKINPKPLQTCLIPFSVGQKLLRPVHADFPSYGLSGMYIAYNHHITDTLVPDMQVLDVCLLAFSLLLWEGLLSHRCWGTGWTG